MLQRCRHFSRLMPRGRRDLSRLALARTPPFALERYFAEHEFSCKISACSSDTEAISLNDVLALMDAETRRLWDEQSLGYTEVKGHPAMLALLAEAYGLEPHCFQEVAPQEGILLAYAALLEPGDGVVCTAPGYQSFHTCAEQAGGAVTFWQCRVDESGARFDVDDLVKACDATPNLKVVSVNFPHNPTGALPSSEEWARIVAICEARGLYLFADEIYQGIGPRLESAATAYDKGISLGGLSKSMGMPGVRIGWLATRDVRFLRRVAELRDYTTICSSAPSQILAMAALQNRDHLWHRANAYVDAGRRAVEAVLARHADVLSWGAGPAAGPVGWVRLRRGSASQYAEALVRSDDGIMLLPSTVFGAGDGHVRVGFGRAASPAVMETWSETLDDAAHPATRLLREG